MKYAIIGGTGTIGKEITKQLLESGEAKKILIYSRDEKKQADMKQRFPEHPDNIMRYMIGDVRDHYRLTTALKGIDRVIFAAAIKRVEVCEYDCPEAIATNTTGALNVVRACVVNGVKQCVLTSTDKAVDPITTYGATKLLAEKIFIHGNNLQSTKFSICRYANVIGSRGSVFELWEEQIKNGGPVTITDYRMTRMFISIEEAAKFVIMAFQRMQGGDILIPKVNARLMIDEAKRLWYKHYYRRNLEDHFRSKEIGLRGAEKIHEKLISECESRECYDCDGYYKIYPVQHDWTRDMPKVGTRVPDGFELTSNTRRI